MIEVTRSPFAVANGFFFTSKPMSKIPNEEQRSVIENLDDNILLFAGAGTGKTFTVAKRVANILARQKALPAEILCLTFTIKACDEMRKDITQFAGERAEEVQVNTIHGFCYKILAQERNGNDGYTLGICDEIDQEEILRNILTTKYYRWILDENSRKLGLSLPDLSACSICKIGEEYFWRTKEFIVTPLGEVQKILSNTQFSPLEVRCPVCDCTRALLGKKCSVCGEEFTVRFEEKTFDIYTKKTPLRSLISEMKHAREEGGYYTEDVIADYQRAFQYIQEYKPAVYEGLFSYNARYLGYQPDNAFLLAMERFAGKMAAEYDEYLRASNLLDFDDLIIKAKRILESEAGETYWGKRYKFVFLDEMQDTTRLEYAVLKKIFAQNNVFLCGDFFQTIYGWRGSCPQELLTNYIREFSAKKYTLSENYRSTKTLTRASYAYLQNTYPKLISEYSAANVRIHAKENGEKIDCYAFDNPEEEATQIYRYLLKNKPKNPMDICIIARSNKYIARLSRYFQRIEVERGKKDGLRFFTVEENFQFFKKPVVKDILAALKLLVYPLDGASMERLTKKYVRRVGSKSIETLREYSSLGISILSFIDGETYRFGDPYYTLLEGKDTGTLVVYDTETTGLDLDKDEIIQLSAIKIDAQGEIVDTINLFIQPTIEISEGAKQTHGLDFEEISARNAITAKEGLQIFSSFVSGSVLVGHNNLAYDKLLISRQLRENNLPPLKIVGEFDTLLLAKRFYPQLSNFKLDTLCRNFSIVNEHAHDALGDITATAQCLVRIIREAIYPTIAARREIVAKYAPKFEKFYNFYEELRARFDNGEELVEYVAERLYLRKIYPTQGDWSAVSDVAQSLKTEEGNRRRFIEGYLKDAALSGSQMDVLVKKLNRIPIVTVHQAKGCEFDTVIIVGADDSNFPSYAAKRIGDEEEEKKIFYVAITRAKRKLILTRATRDGKHAMATPYFWKIPEEFVRMNRRWKNGE